MAVSLAVLPNPRAERPVLGSFSKGIEGSCSLNFGLSAGKYCDRDCAYHPKNKKSTQQGRCYAVRIEIRGDRKPLRTKLVRHEQMDAALLCNRAKAEVQKLIDSGDKPPWFRFSTGGSLPKPHQATKRFKAALLDLIEFLDGQNIPIHLPVETYKKFKFYRRLIGSRCVVRRSTSNLHDFVMAKYPVSFVAGTMEMTRGERITESKRVARLHTERTGRRTIVCPAVAASYLNWGKRTRETNQKAKCGNCTCCAQPGIDIIYPLH